MIQTLERLEKEGDWAGLARAAARIQKRDVVMRALLELTRGIGNGSERLRFAIDGLDSFNNLNTTALLHCIGPNAKVFVVWPTHVLCSWSPEIAQRFTILSIAIAARVLLTWGRRCATRTTIHAIIELRWALWFASSQAPTERTSIIQALHKTSAILGNSTEIDAQMTRHLASMLTATIDMSPTEIGAATTASAARRGVQSTGHSRAVRLAQTRLLIATLVEGEKGLEICRQELFENSPR